MQTSVTSLINDQKRADYIAPLMPSHCWGFYGIIIILFLGITFKVWLYKHRSDRLHLASTGLTHPHLLVIHKIQWSFWDLSLKKEAEEVVVEEGLSSPVSLLTLRTQSADEQPLRLAAAHVIIFFPPGWREATLA